MAWIDPSAQEYSPLANLIGGWDDFWLAYDLAQSARNMPITLRINPSTLSYFKAMNAFDKDATFIAGIQLTIDDSQPVQTTWREVFAASQPAPLTRDKKPSPFTQVKAISPKTLDSSHKVPVTLCPASAIIAIALVIAQGHKKPGRTIYNWRKQPISYLDYISAVQRHLLRSIDGEDFDKELSDLAGVPIRHDWAAMSGLAIIEDARQAGTLIDDRPTKGGAAEFLTSVTIIPDKL